MLDAETLIAVFGDVAIGDLIELKERPLGGVYFCVHPLSLSDARYLDAAGREVPGVDSVNLSTPVYFREIADGAGHGSDGLYRIGTLGWAGRCGHCGKVYYYSYR